VVQAFTKGPFSVFRGDQRFDDPADAQETRTTGSLYAADRLRLGWFDLLAGARLDGDELYGVQISPRATAGVTVPGSRTRATLSYGEGFRPPAFNELHVGALSNPDLDPEHGRSVELGVQQPVGSTGRISGALYASRLRDLITGGADGFVNVSRADLRGVELAADLTPGSFRTGGSVTYTDAKDGDGNRLAGISEWLTSVYAGATLGPVEADAFFYSWSGRKAISPVFPATGGDAIVFTPVGTRVDLSASWWLSEREPGMRLVGRVEDLLDRRDEEFPGFPVPGRTLYVTFELATR
jgi:outer membrane cobalamin receptor